MTPGPKPKPVELRQREGSFRPDRHGGPVVLDVPTDIEEPPEELCETAKEFWRDAVPVLASVGLLSSVDRPALEMLATQYARAKQASRVVEEYGHLARGSTGQLVEHPALRTERDASSQFLRFAEQYGLTPSARARIGLAEVQRRSIQQELVDDLGEPEFEPA